MLVLLAACSGGGDSPTPPPDPPADPAPVATSVSPSTLTAGTGATTLTVTGTGFVARTTVQWNGSARPTTVQGATQLTATVTSADLAEAGTGVVTVQTAAPGGGTSAALTVTIVNPAPVLTAVVPTTLLAGSASATLTVTGTGFVPTSRVHWNGTLRPTTVTSATTLSATLDAVDMAAAGSGTVTVVTPSPGGGSSTGLAVVVNNPAPTVTSVAPLTIPVGSANRTLVVTGTNFLAISKVFWNGTERPTTYTNATTLSATLTTADVAAAGSGNVTVVTAAPGGGTSNATLVTVEAPPVPAPTLTSIAPAGAFAGSGALTVTLTGANFTANSVGRWNGVARTTQFVNATTLTMAVTATDVAAAGVASITVFTPAPGGGQSSAQSFTTSTPLAFDAHTRVSAGSSTSCQLNAAGVARCWGSAVVGGVGDGQLGLRLAPSPVSGGHQFRSIMTQNSQSCGVTTSNTLLCWGRYTTSVSTPTNSPAPVQIPTPEAVASLAISFDAFQCILSVSKAAWCRSLLNTRGQLGTGNTDANNGNFARVTGNHEFEAITVGRSHACALKASGETYCWGAGDLVGRVGAPSASSTPTPIEGAHQFVRISAGSNHTCALTPAGEAWCWGSTLNSVLGAPGGFDRLPVRVVGNHRFVSISAGTAHSCAVDTQGAAWCWGSALLGRTGRLDELTGTTPFRVEAPGVVFTEISAGSDHTCAMDNTNTAWCWGSEEYGKLGNGALSWQDAPTPIAGTSGFTDIDATGQRTCALRNTGAVFCWGEFAAGVTGVTSAAVPTQVTAPRPFVSMSTGNEHACALEADGSAWCWGNGADGRLGGGGTVSSAAPVRVGGSALFSQMDVGGSHSCAIAPSGTFCWGDGSNSAIGDGGTTDALSPVLATGSALFRKISVGTEHSCALDTNGQAFCWGRDTWGALGVGAGGARAVPTATNTAARFESIAAGEELTCALTGGGIAHCWGLNFSGRRGFATGIPQDEGLSPTPIPGGNTWQSIGKGGLQHNCGILAGSALRCWGGNESGQLGVPQGGLNYPYTVVPGSFVKVTTGILHSCALDTAGTVYCWGDRTRGALGDGRLGFRHAAVRVGGS